MANGYASNIPREGLPAEEPALLPEDVCMICKKRAAIADGVCALCGEKLRTT